MADEQEWIPWSGGKRPVPWDAIVITLHRDGSEYERVAVSYPWKHHNRGHDIIAYRVLS